MTEIPHPPDHHPNQAPTRDQLLAIIRTQTEILRLGVSLNGVMSIIAERAAAVTRAGGGVVELADGDDMVYRATSGSVAGQLGVRSRRVGSFSGLAIEMTAMLVCTDTEKDARVDRESCRRAGIRSVVAVPLLNQGTPVGVLKVVSPTVNAFARGDLLTLQLMADVVSAAMFHAAKYGADELFRQATTDALTGLANRALFLDRLRHSLARARRDSTRLSVLFADIDRLKAVNEAHGHRAGDAVLAEGAHRIAAIARTSDTVARLGGDDFAALLTSTGAREDAQIVVARMRERCAASFEFEGHAIAITANFGIAVFPDDGDTPQQILDAAREAMKRAKGGLA